MTSYKWNLTNYFKTIMKEQKQVSITKPPIQNGNILPF